MRRCTCISAPLKTRQLISECASLGPGAEFDNASDNRALTGRRALRTRRIEVRDPWREAFVMREEAKKNPRRGWRKMLRSQRGHTVDDILFLALKPHRRLDIFRGLLSPVDTVLAAPP